MMEIKRASVNEANLVAKLAIQMWDDNSVDGLEADFVDYMNNGGAVFMAWNDNTAIGFAQCGFRHDYVEGTETSPVGYLEGVFVEGAYRRQGIAKELVKACQIFAKEQIFDMLSLILLQCLVFYKLLLQKHLLNILPG